MHGNEIMKAAQFMLNATSLAMLGLFSGGLLAHSVHDKPRYISTAGVDKGSCETVDSPCLTFRYTVTQSNKGDQILVDSGQYQINDTDSLFYLLSEVVPVKTGYSAADNYKVQNHQTNVTHLVGVPVEYADKLRTKGFTVNTDQKTLSDVQKAELDSKLSKYESLQLAQQNEVCANGQAGAYSCENVDLLSHMPLSAFGINSSGATDIWGFIDLNTNKEYAIIGLRNGVSVIDVSNPSEPQLTGTIQAQNTRWRDIKVHQHYDYAALRWKAFAYVTADSASIGLTIIDMNDLDNGISIANIDRTDVSAHNVFMSNVDYSTGVTLTGMSAYLHVTGADNVNASGAYSTFSLADGSTAVNRIYNPDITASYTHDASAMTIDDDRVNSQCVPVNGVCEILFDYSVNKVTIWDKTDNANPNLAGIITWNNPQYIHSGWSTEDNNFVLVHDELDEQRNGLNTTLRIFDISNLNQPQLFSTWTGPTPSIDHNGFVRGSRYYMSNYEKGLTILDISNPATPTEIGNFDTFPPSDNASFNGAWGVYPFLPSGNILVSDINSGLYVLADKTVGSATQDSVKLNANSYVGEEGENIVVNVTRVGDPAKAVTVQYETHAGSAKVDDFSMVKGTLNWAAGDTADKQISITVNADSLVQEYTETLFVRLYNPTNGLALAAPNISTVHINGLALSSYGVFAQETIEVKEIDGTITIPVNRAGDLNGELSVNFETLSDTATVSSDFENNSGTLTWVTGESGAKNISLTLVNDSESEGNENLIIKLNQNDDSGLQLMTVVIRDDESNAPAQVTVSDSMTVNASEVINLVAMATDPEGYALSYEWSQTSGTTVVIPNATDSSIAVTAPANADTLVFEVKVTDDFGAVTAKSVSVTVNSVTTTPTPTPPVNNSSGGGSMWLFPMLGMLFARRRMK